MGKGEESGGSEASETLILGKTSSEASEMLEAALLQMDGIISGLTLSQSFCFMLL